MRPLLRFLPFVVAGTAIAAPPLEAQGAEGNHRWSVSTSLSFPFVGIFANVLILAVVLATLLSRVGGGAGGDRPSRMGGRTPTTAGPC